MTCRYSSALFLVFCQRKQEIRLNQLAGDSPLYEFMKILILTYGSRGDVQPFVALGQGLKAAGYDVVLGTSDRFRGFVEGHGLRYGYMNDDMLKILDTDQGRDLLENTRNIFQVVKQTLRMMKQVGPWQRSLLEESWALAREMEPDLVIFHPKAYAGPHIGEKFGIPVVLAMPVPIIVPTSEHPNMGFPDLKLGGWYNRQTYKMVNRLMGFSAKKHADYLREMMGLPRQKSFDLLHMTDGRDIPVLHAYSGYVMPAPRDWPDHVIATGYWFLDARDEWTPPGALSDFLASGPPPIYIGFGSMAGRHPERLANAVVDALQKTGLRGIIASGWGGLKARDLPNSILQIEQAPHDWLLPQVTAVVHHGGAGTTAAGLRAGKPSVMVPFFGDQPFWAKRLYQLEVSPKPIPQKKLTGDLLAKTLQEVATNSEMREAAEKIGRKIRAEDGVRQAVSFIESPVVMQRKKGCT